LQHCSEIGELAFSDARERLHHIVMVKTYLEESGIIECTLRLEYLDDIKYNLRTKIEDLRDLYGSYSTHCGVILGKFTYWHQLSIHLSKTLLDLRGMFSFAFH
jgi:hypothetical protein